MRNLGVNLFLGSSSSASKQMLYPNLSATVGKQDLVSSIGEVLKIKEISKLPDNFKAQIDALQTEGIADIVSTPQIATLNGNSASITISKTFYYVIENSSIITSTSNLGQSKTREVKSIDTKISLSVTPWVSASKEVTVEIKPVFQIPGVQPSTDMPPNVDTRELTSTIRLKDGETYILGGLVQDVNKQTISKVPFLGDIPFLGRIFRSSNVSKEKSQLIIFLTPHVYFGSEASVDQKDIIKYRSSKEWSK
jgi:type IV pilus assembly protein PilQ